MRELATRYLKVMEEGYRNDNVQLRIGRKMTK